MDQQQTMEGSVGLCQPSDAPATPTSVEVEQRIAHLQWARERGKEFHNSSLSRFSIPLVKAAAQVHGIPPADAKRYVQYYRAYSQGEFDEMLALFRAENFALRFTCFRVLVAVRDRAKRKELTTRAVQERRGSVELRTLKEETLGSSGTKGGRRPGVLKQSGEKLEGTVVRTIKKFARYVEMVLAAKTDLRPEFRCELQQILDALQ